MLKYQFVTDDGEILFFVTNLQKLLLFGACEECEKITNVNFARLSKKHHFGLTSQGRHEKNDFLYICYKNLFIRIIYLF